MKSLTLACLSALLLVISTGCFRVGSDTQALRDAALAGSFARADEQLEVGVGFFTVGAVRLAVQYLDLPPEARTAISALKNAECAIYQVSRRQQSLAAILENTDRAMRERGCERLVGVIQGGQLIAVYVPVPAGLQTSRDLQASVLVLSGGQLVCATARADAADLLQLAMTKARDHLPASTAGAGAL